MFGPETTSCRSQPSRWAMCRRDRPLSLSYYAVENRRHKACMFKVGDESNPVPAGLFTASPASGVFEATVLRAKGCLRENRTYLPTAGPSRTNQ